MLRSTSRTVSLACEKSVDGDRDGLSQRGGFVEDPLLQVRAESTIGQNVDSAAKKVGEILFETDDVEERSTLLDLHEQVEIAARAIIAAGHRSEHADIPHTVTGGQRQNLMTPRAEFLDRHPLNDSDLWLRLVGLTDVSRVPRAPEGQIAVRTCGPRVPHWFRRICGIADFAPISESLLVAAGGFPPPPVLSC
jgi:hypothetical protein